MLIKSINTYKITAFSMTELLVVIVIIAVVTIIAIPAYSNYVARANMAEVIGEVQEAQRQVQLEYQTGKTLDQINYAPNAVSFTTPASEHIKSISIDDGKISIEFADSLGVPDSKMSFSAAESADKMLSWSCSRSSEVANIVGSYCENNLSNPPNFFGSITNWVDNAIFKSGGIFYDESALWLSRETNGTVGTGVPIPQYPGLTAEENEAFYFEQVYYKFLPYEALANGESVVDSYIEHHNAFLDKWQSKVPYSAIPAPNSYSSWDDYCPSYITTKAECEKRVCSAPLKTRST